MGHLHAEFLHAVHLAMANAAQPVDPQRLAVIGMMHLDIGRRSAEVAGLLANSPIAQGIPCGHACPILLGLLDAPPPNVL
jgi:hypothetical protein